MPSIDDRIVSIQFDNSAFQRNIQSTLASLGQLDKALMLTNGQKGFENVNAAAKQVDLSGISRGVDSISSKFNALGAIGFTVIQTLTQSAMGFLKQVGGDILAPIIEGGTSRAKAIEHAQFMFRGLGIDVTQAMDDAKQSVLGTAYGLGEAANAAAQFAASGIALGDQMKSSLRGVAGAAAMTGTSFSEIAYIYQGIAGANRVTTMDLMQFSTRGLNVAASMAKVMGKTEQEIRDMVSNGSIDFATFAKAMDDAFGAHAKAANETYTGSLANMKAALSRLGAAFITPQLEHMRDLFNAITPKIDEFTKAIKPAIDAFTIISGWAVSGLIKAINGIGFDHLKDTMPILTGGMVNIYTAVKNVWTVAKNLFTEMFPATAISTVQRIVDAFVYFSFWVKDLSENTSTLRGIFQIVFSTLSIGWTIIKEGAKFLWNLGKSVAAIFSPGVTGFIENFGNKLANLQDALVWDGGIKKWFDELTVSLQKPLQWLKKFHDAVASLFDGFRKSAADGVTSTADAVGKRFQALRDRLGNIWDPFITAAEKIWSVLERVGNVVGDWLKGLWDKLAAGISSQDFQAILDVINTSLIGGVAVMLSHFLKGGFNFNFIPGIANLGGTLTDLRVSLATLQGKLKAEALMKLAEAIAVLTASVVVLSMIDSASLTKALAAMSIGFGELLGTFAAIQKMGTIKGKGGVDFQMIAGGMIALGVALLFLSSAVKKLSKLSWNDLVKGLGGVVVLLGALVIASKPLSANSKGMVTAGVGIQAMSVGLFIMAAAVRILGTMSWEDMIRGLTGVMTSLAGIVIAMRFMPKDAALVKAGFSILIVATAIAILGGAVAIFASMNWESMGKGLLGLALALGGVVVALNLMPKDMGTSAGAILAVGVAIAIIAGSMKAIANLSWEQIAKGLVGIGVAMGLMVGASLLMEGAIPGAGAMIIVAGALLIMAKAIKIVGKLSVAQLVTGLIGIAAAIAMVALASLAAVEAIPVIAALGAALILLGAGIALMGLGAFLFAKAIGVILLGSEKLITNLPKVLEAIAMSIPMFLKGIAQGIVDMISVFTKAAPAIMKALGIFLVYLIDTLIKLTPKIFEFLSKLLDGMIKLVYQYTEPLIAAGIHIITSFLKGISNNIKKIVKLVADIITKFLDAFAEETPRVVDSLVNTITTWFLQTAEGMGEIAGTLLVGIGIAFVNGLLTGIGQQLDGPVFNWFLELPGKILGWLATAGTWLLQKGIDILTGLWNGLVAGVTTVFNWFVNLPGNILTWIGDTLGTLKQMGINLLTGLYNGITEKVTDVVNWLAAFPRKVIDSIISKGGKAIDWLVQMGENIMKGLWEGMKSMWNHVTGWLSNLDPRNWFNDINVEKGHAEVNLLPMGYMVMQGLHTGMIEGWAEVTQWLQTLNPSEHIDNNVGAAMSKAISTAALKLSDLPEYQPTITPVLDLTKVAAEASKINGMMGVGTLTPNASFKNARIISADHANRRTDTSLDVQATKSVEFHQTINAPKELSTADIYTNTRTQIQMAKEELSIP